MQDKFGDVHTRLMKKNYDAVPQWWFYSILIVVVGLAIFACEGFGKQLQLPYWGVLLAAGLALVFTLPIGVITATTNQVSLLILILISLIYSLGMIKNEELIFISLFLFQQPGLNVLTELIIGYIYPGRPLANVAFKTYGYISMTQAITFLADFKLGHYMKIPPKSMFLVQVKDNYLKSSKIDRFRFGLGRIKWTKLYFVWACFELFQ